jgi:macrolide-specific efflux system membrane fusion protein
VKIGPLLRFIGVGRDHILATTLFILSIAFTLGAVATASKRYVAAGNASYLTVPVVRGDVQSVVMATGTLQAHQQVDVGAQVSGQLKSVRVKLGDHVLKGQLLAEIDPALPLSALRSARASLLSLQAQRRAVAASLWQADMALQRQTQMRVHDATSQQDVEAAKAQAEVLRANLASFTAQISQAGAQVETAEANVAYTMIRAPIDGDVVGIVTQEGQTVVASQQAPVIMKLAQLDTITVKAQISEADVIRIESGQAAYFTILGDSDGRHGGTLRAVEPAPPELQGNEPKAPGPVFYNALFEADNADHRLRIGMTAQVTVIINRAANALTVPLSALGERAADGRYPVRVVGPHGDLQTLMVAIGINDKINVQLLDGPREGDRVVVADDGA